MTGAGKPVVLRALGVAPSPGPPPVRRPAPMVGSQTQSDAVTAVIIVVVWFVAGAAWFAWNSRRLGRPARVQQSHPSAIAS